MRKLAHALNVSYDYLKHDEITDPSYGIEKWIILMKSMDSLVKRSQGHQ